MDPALRDQPAIIRPVEGVRCEQLSPGQDRRNPASDPRTTSLSSVTNNGMAEFVAIELRRQCRRRQRQSPPDRPTARHSPRRLEEAERASPVWAEGISMARPSATVATAASQQLNRASSACRVRSVWCKDRLYFVRKSLSARAFPCRDFPRPVSISPLCASIRSGAPDPTKERRRLAYRLMKQCKGRSKARLKGQERSRRGMSPAHIDL